jgi:hypothetical protein
MFAEMPLDNRTVVNSRLVVPLLALPAVLNVAARETI